MPSGNDDPQCRIEDLEKRIAELESALLVSEEKFHTVTDFAPVGIFLDNAQGKAIFINKKCAELIGVQPEDALNFDWIPFLHPDDRDRMVSEWEKAFKNSTPFRLEYRWVHSDGKVVWTLGEVVPVIGEDGNAHLFIGTLTDVTARKQAELEREKLQAQLVQAQRMESIGRLAGGVAHDYNNMLSAILGYSQLAMSEVDPADPVHEMLREISNAAKRSAEITRQLLGYASRQLISPRVFTVNESVRDMLNMLRRLIGEGIELVWVPYEGRISVRMDPSQFDQVVVNLCINARDAIGSSGKIQIATNTVALDEAYCAEHPKVEPGVFIHLSICDNGCGMDSQTLENVFEPFFTTKAEGAGTGLGLASVYGTVKQNGGFIDVVSELGVGTTFNVYLPLYSGAVTENSTPAPVANNKGRGETILIVEDEAAILRMVTRILENAGYNVLAANSVDGALELVACDTIKIDLLITDVIMPMINGRELAQQLQSLQPTIKCLFMSGYTADVLSDQGVLEQDVNFIQKPFGTQSLIAKVEDTLKT